ncbi:mannose 6-phosphate receptor domain-containing protein [Pholiota conissans]|uniref:Autophagy-related protein 27 n=1 Tax=Pholiota conissans TaxID=109636 RepID=A0A9P6CYS4_9AGAR|nr:mannose 6-phosphate receptor domain-containing protein [Pholiota conissans]
MFARTNPLFPLLLLILVHYGVLAQEKPCIIHNDGKYYDLNPLKSSKDYEVKTSTGQSIWLNVCQNVKTDLFGIKDDFIDAGDVGGFIRRGHGDFIIGKVNTSLSIFDSRPRFVMSGGSRCKPKAGDQTTEIRASTMVEFVCDASVYGQGSPRLLAQLPPGEDEVGCAYVIEWRTHFACPTSESGGLWGFITILAVIFLVLLMSYTILGVLYNRFVLQLRGFDQIPQFSIESMKYHGREAWDWIKDMTAALDIGGTGGARGFTGRPSGGSRMPNPVSHHSQAAGFGHSDDPEERAPLTNSTIGGAGPAADFVRPQLGRNRSAAFQRMDINPVSHQSQVAAGTQSLSYSPSASPPSTPMRSPPQTNRSIPQTRRLGPDARNSAPEERDFMLGDDDEDAQELGEVKAPPPLVETRSSNTGSSPSQGSAVGVSASGAQSPEPNPAAAARGRDLGGGEVIRL